MINLKRTIYLSLVAGGLIAGGAVLQACEDEFLDRRPLSDLTTANFYTSAEDALAALNAAYDPLQWDVHSRMDWIIGDVVGGDTDKGSTDDQDYIQIRQFQYFTATAGIAELNEWWSQSYDGVYRANLVLERVPPIEMDEALKARILGEAKFLRAQYYFDLVKAFGRVPIITSVLDPEEVFVPRPASIAENWAQIEQDLRDAIEVLPASYNGADVGRATRGAAQALLAKSLLWQSTPEGCSETPWATQDQYQEVVDLTDAIINSGNYRLVQDFESIFLLEGENSPEHVFSVQGVGGTGGWANENDGLALNQWLSPRTADISGWGFSTPIGPNTPANYGGNANIQVNNIYEAFEPCDPRLEYSILEPGDTINGLVYDDTWSRSGYSIQKFLIPEDELTGAANSPLNIPLIRYADVMLWNAEALNELGRTEEALESLNAVRRRARESMEGATCPQPVTSVSQAELRDIIIEERRRELAFEGHRFFDLVRTCRAEEVLNAMGRPFEAGVNELLPIPQAEIDRNPELQGDQNPGF
ncbi:RagB/SusD family nutrient uptake outer membrane protein [Pontibacter diazotrophicus]|uniref:RagB/SusD family nutrient uptake outer membrane protein n=1 Tax=Pontibacter diazotrophicus TaxID=1400979 RepID=A0A3D8LCD5_9BACT|nr:RagB/SusD family nutrient uptake outer membrane protein [Pontibacter diazotrophicus]RDV15077.1 RagB/SusD family nutrient uptake outer membrane protein [Pontibacter diazotrophicus]